MLALLEEPIETNLCQVHVMGYLQQFVGNMRNEEVCRFLRFTTGSSAIVVKCISVAFNNLSGLSRRPIAHTCMEVFLSCFQRMSHT